MTRRIAFCSFKGGSGRTVALANVAVRLASQGYRVGCVDLDIESSGLNQVVGVYRMPEGTHIVQTYFLNDGAWRIMGLRGRRPTFTEEAEFESLVIDLGKYSSIGAELELDRGSGKIFLIAAEPQPTRTAAALRSASNNESTANLFRDFERFKNLDYLLVDCRSGVSTLTLPGLRWTHEVLIFFRPGRQHREGTAAMVRWLIADRNQRLERANGEIDPHLPERISLVGAGVVPSAEEDVLTWMKELARDPELRALGIIRDHVALRSREQIIKSGASGDDEGIGVDYDNLASAIL